MKIVIPKINSFLDLGLVLMIVKVVFSISAIVPYTDLVDTILSVLSASLLFIVIIQKKYSFKVMLIYGIIGAFALYSTFVSANFGFLITIITCMAIRGEDIDRVIRFIFRYELILFIFHSLLTLFVYLFTDYSLWTNIYGAIRFNGGFTHPNSLSIYSFNLIIMWVWLNYENIKKRDIAWIFIVGIVVYLFTETRTTLINIFVLVFLLANTRGKKQSGKLITWMAMFIVPIISVFFLVGIKLYINDNMFIKIIDRIFTARIRLGAYAYDYAGLTWFGQSLRDMNVVWDSFWRLTGHTFDCTYTFLMMNQGAIWLVLISILFYKMAKWRSNKINIAIIIWSLYAMSEVHGLNGFKCYSIFLVVLLFQNKETIKKHFIHDISIEMME